jgi:hypothetical protein
MYHWYQKAKVCYAYLSDVLTGGDTPETLLDLEAFKSSRWFTRGWTLQELLAPVDLQFFSMDWRCLGTKQGLRESITDVTGIQTTVLLDCSKVFLFSAACRMSWAAERTTTRVEDLAYCLMGLFGINMPLLYGEGEKAFFRLQGEFVKISNDHSLLAWRHGNGDQFQETANSGGLLSSSLPKNFVGSGGVCSLGTWGRSAEYSFTNNGMLIDLFLVP